jgi:hypothetical protein
MRALGPLDTTETQKNIRPNMENRNTAHISQQAKGAQFRLLLFRASVVVDVPWNVSVIAH